MTKKKPTQLTLEDKYRYYEEAVQNPEHEIEVINDKFDYLYGKKPKVLREDFGGTGLFACEWAKQSPEHYAYAIDLDPEPIAYGQNHHYARLSSNQKQRVQYLQQDVLKSTDVKADVVTAFNFSYLALKTRHELLSYFRSVRESLNAQGAFFMDLMGGTETQNEVEEETDHGHFKYYWDCKDFNAVTNEVQFAIHFKPKKGKKIENVFTYEWRFWGLPEIRDVLMDAGFSKSYVFWEGDDEDGEGNGIFSHTEREENCETWICYVVAVP